MRPMRTLSPSKLPITSKQLFRPTERGGKQRRRYGVDRRCSSAIPSTPRSATAPAERESVRAQHITMQPASLSGYKTTTSPSIMDSQCYSLTAGDLTRCRDGRSRPWLWRQTGDQEGGSYSRISHLSSEYRPHGGVVDSSSRWKREKIEFSPLVRFP
jgi:hypothetical protein